MSVIDDIIVDAFSVGAAKKSVRRIVRARAKHYGERPLSLETVYPGLSFATCHQLIATGQVLAERGKNIGRIGYGGEVTIINAKGVVLLGRWMRRFGSEAGGRAAA